MFVDEKPALNADLEMWTGIKSLQCTNSFFNLLLISFAFSTSKSRGLEIIEMKSEMAPESNTSAGTKKNWK